MAGRKCKTGQSAQQKDDHRAAGSVRQDRDLVARAGSLAPERKKSDTRAGAAFREYIAEAYGLVLVLESSYRTLPSTTPRLKMFVALLSAWRMRTSMLSFFLLPKVKGLTMLIVFVY